MHSLRKLKSVIVSATILIGWGCAPGLDVTNPNAPDIARALASPEDVKNLAISSVNTWYLASTTEETYVMLSVTADAGTMNFGNFGVRFNNLEPRLPYANNSASNDKGVSEDSWKRNYGALGAANDALRAFAGGLLLSTSQDTTAKYRRLAQFTQAASMTNLALLFDQAFITDETTVPGAPIELQNYKIVSAAAVTRWAALATDAAGKSDAYSVKTELPLSTGQLTSAKLARLANTYAALTLAYTPRNAAEAATVDWVKVAQYADKGIGTGSAGAPFDFTIEGDQNVWYSDFLDYATSPSWVNVDQRIIHMLDPNVPAKFNGTKVPPTATPADARLTTDFTYTDEVVGDPGRGIYMQSPYFHSRYDYYSFEGETEEIGPAPYILAAESDLVLAEALIRSGGSLATAASLINTTRVGRGGLPAAAAGDGAPTLLGYIAYERDVELLNTNAWTLFQRRHIDGLQSGTVHHLPVPASELETLGLPVYTFGGPGKEQSLGQLGTGMLSSLSPAASTVRSIALPNGKTIDLHFPVIARSASRFKR